MEKLNLNFNGSDNIIKSICWILSVLSWLLFIVTGWISLRWLKKFFIVWTIHRMPSGNGAEYLPLQMQTSLIYIVFICMMTIALAGFIIYIIFSTAKKDESVEQGMLGSFSKFHFFPLLCASALFIIGICIDKPTPKTNTHHEKDMIISSLIFSILGLGSLVFIYIMTDLNTDKWYVILTLKKGTYSCLMALMWYNFCYNIFYVRAITKPESKDLGDWLRGCGIAFSIIFGIGTLAMSYLFKDLVIAGMTTLIYVGLTAFYFKLNKEKRKQKEANKNGDGIVDIIMLVGSVALLAYLLLTKREECLKS